jgi:hypothetical protein
LFIDFGDHIAAVGIFASAELHEMAMAASGASTTILVKPEDSANTKSQQMKLQVVYSVEGVAQPVSSAPGKK